MTRKTALAAIKAYFEENTDTFNQAIDELDSYNGILGDDRYYQMADIDEIYHDTDASEVLARAFYGYDADNYSTNADGTKNYSAFNPNRDYFYFNGYANLVSTDFVDYGAYLNESTIEDMSENRQYISAIDDDIDLSDLFDALEEGDDDTDSN